jgi:Nif-specific regulatory protein
VATHRDTPEGLATLVDITRALSGTLKLDVAMAHVLDLLAQRLDVVRSQIALLHERHLVIQAAHGYGSRAVGTRYAPGEGIVGRVADSGRPVVVARMSREPALVYRAARRPELPRGELTFICVPLLLNRRAIGTLAVDLPHSATRDYERDAALLSVVASLVAQGVRIHRLAADDRRRLEDENTHLRRELRDRYEFSSIIGTSGAVREVFDQVAQVAGTNTTVLVRGESGTGKELIAHAIHYNSPRAQRPFVRVSCAALPDSLIESELFGYEKGAFTGADARKKGRFELAEGGTLFLDEIGEVNPVTQVKLLRVLQSREIERLGGTETIKVDVRLVAATNTDMERAIAAGTFRQDLYYRLNVFSIFVPPLRERKSDLVMLVDHFLERFSREHRRPVKRISTPAIDMLMAYHWPGNVRELENALERAVLASDGQVVHAHHLPPSLQTAEATGTSSCASLSAAVDAYEKDLILDALKTARGNQARAARLLSTTERILSYKVRRHRIDIRRIRQATAAS